jgi:hypothetical protein
MTRSGRIIFRLPLTTFAMLAASSSLCLSFLKVNLYSFRPHKVYKVKVHVWGGHVCLSEQMNKLFRSFHSGDRGNSRESLELRSFCIC